MKQTKNIVKLTKSLADKVRPTAGKDQIFYRDSELKGFALRITANGTKSFVVEKIIGNKVRRITLGKYSNALPVEKARRKAQVLLGQIADGIDPIAEKRATKMRSVSLKEVLDDYMQARKSLKPKTLYDYQRVLNIAFDNWKNKPLTSITKEMVAKQHKKLGQENGEAYANLAMRVLRALFNFAAGQYEDSQGRSLINDNPVKRLSQTRAWYRVERRQSFIKSHELSDWYAGVQKLTNETLRDYLLLILFTGLRRQEAAKLQWSQVDLKAKTLTIIDTKNREPHTLPLSHYLFNLFSNRKLSASSHYVFPGTGADGHIIEPRKQMAKVINETKIQFTVHDLRRTFITMAESLDIAAYALKRLLNHKMNGDVTAGYIMLDVERLRKPMQMITDYIIRQITSHQSSIIPLSKVQKDVKGDIHEMA
jgi:integrase